MPWRVKGWRLWKGYEVTVMAIDLNGLVKQALAIVEDLLPTEGTLVQLGPVITPPNPATNESAVYGSDIQTVINITPPSNYNSFQIDGTNIRRDDLKTIVASADMPSTFLLSKDPKLIYNGITYLIIDFNNIATGNDIPAYELQLRL